MVWGFDQPQGQNDGQYSHQNKVMGEKGIAEKRFWDQDKTKSVKWPGQIRYQKGLGFQRNGSMDPLS